MTEPASPLAGRPDAPLGRVLAGIREKQRQGVTGGPVDDGPRPDEPGHPEYHRRNRAEWALQRWATATPPRYQKADAVHPAIAAWADRAATDPATAGNLLLTGTTGTGKTHQAYGALRRIAAAGSTHPYEIRATTAADMYGLLRPKGSDRGTEAELARLTRVPLLLLDDLGSAKASEWVEEITYRLVNERYNACRPTIYTSNLPARADRGPDLATALGDRIVSRLSEDTTVVAITGTDRRRQNRNAA
ncbi:ATP-binding protein [Streptomyces sp. NPDC006798]|uniref:ATP-binding protein n=1 Tax=Streptomyces sp. NPDC006798 TaxID=3155462 RepID=UPI003406155E